MKDIPAQVTQRILELENKITFQEDLLEQLNQSLIRQQKDIARLTQLTESLFNQLQQISQSELPQQKAEPPPPHY